MINSTCIHVKEGGREGGGKGEERERGQVYDIHIFVV